MKLFYFFLLLISADASAQCLFTRTKCGAKKSNRTSQTSLPNDKRYSLAGVGYELALPVAAFRNGIGSAHSLYAQGGLPVKTFGLRWTAGAEIGYGTYAVKNFHMGYQFGENNINTDVTYMSNVLQAGLFGQYAFSDKGRVQPFVSVRAGYVNLNSHLFVEDPSDASSCSSVDAQNLLSDGALYWGYGAGMRIGVGKGINAARQFVELSVQRTRGGCLNYINVNKLQEQSAPLTVTEGAKPMNVNFINTSTNAMHQHTVAEVFRNPLDMVQVRAAYVVKLFRK